MKDDESRLKSLLSYWLDHNQEHGAEFRQWAEKIALYKNEVAEGLKQAADKMAEIDQILKKSRDLLK